jgi:hypothetical protein
MDNLRSGAIGGISSARGHGTGSLASRLRRGALFCGYRFADDMNAVLKLLEKYADVPMSIADACLVRMTETLNDPVLLTTAADFRIYRRHAGRSFRACCRAEVGEALAERINKLGDGQFSPTVPPQTEERNSGGIRRR